MNENELITTIEALRELEALIEEAKAEAETLKDTIKTEMLDRGIDELTVGQYVLRYPTVMTSRFDTTGFRRYYNDLYTAFTKTVVCKRFSICEERSDVGLTAHGIP